MIFDGDVSVIIPTIGRASLRLAVGSALNQTVPPKEVIVVLDADCEPELPESDVISVVRTAGGAGASGARQVGVDSSTGDVIALLDDDDVWRADKLEKQLASVPESDEWVISCRFVAHPIGREPVTIPRRLIGPSESVTDYFFIFRSLRFGGASLQTSTLVFPRSVAKAVPLSVSAGSVHDDPLWLMEVRRAFPSLPIIQRPETLVEYGMTEESLSRSTEDRSRDYIDWGLSELTDVSTRVRGDYLLTSPVAAAVAAGSLRGVTSSIIAGARSGRPGAWAWAYASAGLARILSQRARVYAGRWAAKVRR